MDILEIDFAALESCYTKQLKDVILPFWQKNSYDSEYGGFYTCFSNDGSRLLSTDKYIWSQGRMVWILSKLSKMDIFAENEKACFLNQAKHTLDFMMKHCFLDEDLTCAFLISREGQPLEQEPGIGLSPSTFADCFVALALIAFMDASNDYFGTDILERLFNSIIHRYQTDRYLTSPFYLPPGAKYHAIPMMLLNVCNEYGDFLNSIGRREQAETIYQLASNYCKTILNTFALNSNVLVEMVDPLRSSENNFLFSYVNPGHSLEDCWFMLICAVRQNDRETIQRVLSIIDASFQLGWDQKYGGILYYVHKDGGRPKGDCRNENEQKAADQMLADCDNKLWWPNTEAMYATLLAYSLSNDNKYLEMFIQLHRYTLHIFPNANTDVGEWIQLRDREGKPFLHQVGGRLPVKDPYHIPRDLILLIQLTRKLQLEHSGISTSN